MMSIVLSIVGTTFVYGGILTSEQDLTAGMVTALVGVVLLVKPLADAVRYLKPLTGRHTAAGRSGKRHLRIVRPPKDDRPTIH